MKRGGSTAKFYTFLISSPESILRMFQKFGVNDGNMFCSQIHCLQNIILLFGSLAKNDKTNMAMLQPQLFVLYQQTAKIDGL